MRKELTWEQAEAVHQCGVEVYYRFPAWLSSERCRLVDRELAKGYGPAKLHTAYAVGGQYHYLGAGLPSFFVEVE